MVIPNGWCAKRGPTGETYYWPSDLSMGTTWVYPTVEDPVELQNAWAKLTYITLRRSCLSAEEEGAILERFRLVFASDKFLWKYCIKLQKFADKMTQALVLMRDACTFPHNDTPYPAPPAAPVPPIRPPFPSPAAQSTTHQYDPTTGVQFRPPIPPPPVSPFDMTGHPCCPLSAHHPQHAATSVIPPPPGSNILHPHITPAMDTPQPAWGQDVSVAHPPCTGSQQENICHVPTAHDPLSHPTLNPPSVSPWLPAPRPYPGMTPSSSHEFPPLPDTPPEVTSWPVPSGLYTAGAYHPYTTGHDTSPRITPAAPTATVWGPWDGNPQAGSPRLRDAPK